MARDASGDLNAPAFDEVDGNAALLRALLADGSAPFALFDADGRYRRVSRALAELDGIPAEDHIGRSPHEILPPELGAHIEACAARVVMEGVALREAERRPGLPGLIGNTRYIDAHWSPVRDREGRVIGALAVLHDVTDRHRIADLLGSTQWRIGKLQTVARELAGALTLAEVRAAVAKLGQVTGAAHVDLRLLDPAGHTPWPARSRTALAVPVAPAVPAAEGAGVPHGTTAANGTDVHGTDGYPDSASGVPGQRRSRAAEDDRWERRTALWPPLLTAAVRAGRASYLPNRAAARAAFPESAAWPGPLEDEHAWALLPLVTAAGPVGGLYLVYEQERSFDEDDQAYLQALAMQCTMAVARARMHEREHRQVVSLQEALLPKRLPDLPGVDAAFRYIPGSLDTEVGGDWYDLFGFPDGRLGMVVGDVIGKGVTAAAGMGRVRAALRALAFTDPSPRAVLTGLDRLFDATENAESLTTVVYAVFDPAGGSFLMADAGHLPLLVVTASGEAAYVDATPEATPLGWSEHRVEHRVALRPGDIVIGFSDGLVETRDAPIDEGLARLREAAATAPDTALEPLLDHLVGTMLRDHEQGDDVTVLAVRLREADLPGA